MAKTKHRFTLIELLVTVAIIAILFSLLMPSLSKAKHLASRIACTNNMKQIHLAVLSYTESYQSWMPITKPSLVYDSTSAYALTWMQTIHPFLNGKTFDGDPKNSCQALYCPAGSAQTLKNGKGQPLTNYAYTSFLGHMYYATSSIAYKPRRMDKCPKPSTRAYFLDGKCISMNSILYDFGTMAEALVDVDLRHPGGTNALFVDGHVEQDKILNQTDQDIINKYKWVYYWPY